MHAHAGVKAGMKAAPKARFFCENCGAEVRAGTAVCPSCGRTFTAVRCPSCGFEGPAPEFTRGCPACGYSERPAADRRRSPGRAPRRKASLPAGFYRALLVFLAALTLALLLMLLLRA